MTHYVKFGVSLQRVVTVTVSSEVGSHLVTVWFAGSVSIKSESLSNKSQSVNMESTIHWACVIQTYTVATYL